MDVRSEESYVSLPDQLPIHIVDSLETNQSFKAVAPKFSLKSRKSKKLQNILRPKNPVKTKYFTAATFVNDKNARDLGKEASPFACPKDLEEFAYKVLNKEWRNDQRVKALQLKYYNKLSYKDKQNEDLLNRIYVKEPYFEEMKTMIDIDSNYYEIVQGRPIPDKLDIRKYIETVRDSLRTKVVTGYRMDDILLINQTLLLEQKIIDIIKQNLQQYVNAFEEFLLTDHDTAINLLKDADDASRYAYDKYVEYNEVTKKYASLSSSMFNVEEKWRLCKMYQKFLYTVSPLSWRMAQTLSKRASIYVSHQLDDNARYTIVPMRVDIMEKGISLEDILQEFKDEVTSFTPPQLYFSDPEELMEVFRFMEIQNLNSLLHTEELAVPLQSIKHSLALAVDAFDIEIKNLQEVIDALEVGISWEEDRARYLEKLALNLLECEFRSLVMNEEVLNMSVLVEDIYEYHIGPNDANLETVELMKAIEEHYRHELLFLDKLPSVQVHQLEGNYYEQEMMVMKLAEKAARQFAELEKITSNLRKSYEPPAQPRTVKELKKRSAPIKPPKKMVAIARTLTEEEENYLEHFTEYCKFTDNIETYGIDINQEPDHRLKTLLEGKKTEEDANDIKRN